MNRRFAALAVVLLVAFAGLSWLGYRAIEIHARGLAGMRMGEFVAVADQIRQDVKRKLDQFIQTEQERPYTDYQPYYVPTNQAPNQQRAQITLRSPLENAFEQGLAAGYFQIDSDGTVVTPYEADRRPAQKGLDQRQTIRNDIQKNLLPVLNANLRTGRARRSEDMPDEPRQTANAYAQKMDMGRLQKQSRQTKTLVQPRQWVESNVSINQPESQRQSPPVGPGMGGPSGAMGPGGMGPPGQSLSQSGAGGMVTIHIEPFVPLVIPADDPGQPVVGKKVFLLRHVQVENRHFLQGFQLQQQKLMAEIRDSTAQLMRKGMTFDFARRPDDHAAYSAGLDFDFGTLVLNLKETDAGWILRQVRRLQQWYFSIIAVVLLAVALGLLSVWRNMRDQLRLAQKKDDFISAVSHELRTPLTSIRMYTEMLENNWIKSDDKRPEYYASMRQESERLSRLIENVLDFSRIQRGRKQYAFQLGDINACIDNALRMLEPAVRQAGFTVVTDFAAGGPVRFDPDAVAQVIINLVDNALKYARAADDKTITIRTRTQRDHLWIEVEDRGPGIPHHERKKIFDEFYRGQDEARRETTGVGLGLALVQKFVQAHHGFVEVLAAKPTGALFRIAIPTA